MGEYGGLADQHEYVREGGTACVDLADNWLNLTRLDLRVYVDNEAAISLYEKFRFEVEGTHKRFAYRNGEYVDAHDMARLR